MINTKFWLEPELKASFLYSKQITAFHSKSFYLATKLLPDEKQWATFALYGFCRYLDNLVDTPRLRDKTEILDELTSVSKELKRAYQTKQSEHPVIKSFIVIAIKYNIPIKYPEDLIKGVTMDLIKYCYDTYDNLYLYCYRVAGVVGKMMTHVMGYSDPIAFDYAEKLGVAMQLANILRDIEEDSKMNRIYVPLQELEKFNLTFADIRQQRYSEKMKLFMAFQVERAETLFNEAEPGIRLLDKQAQFAISSASKIYAGILNVIKANDYNPFKGRVYVSKSKKIILMLTEFIKGKISIQPEQFEADFNKQSYPYEAK